MDSTEKVLQTLKDAPEPLKAGDIAELAGMDKKEVDKAIKALKKDGKITTPKRCYYAATE